MAIRVLQLLLNSMGARLQVDGRYGPRTDAVMRRYLAGGIDQPFNAPTPPTDRAVSVIVVHCAATRLGEDDHVDAAEIRGWHIAPPRNYRDIGYHYVIRRDGVVEVGRPIGDIGAHVAGHNTGTVGVCLVGGYNADGLAVGEIRDLYTAAQINALDTLLDDLTGWWPDARVCGHRDFPNVNKACPSFDAGRWWGRDRLRLAK